MRCYALVDTKKKVIKMDAEGMLCIFDTRETAEAYFDTVFPTEGIEIWERDLKMLHID